MVGILWLTFFSQIGILSFVDTFGAFFGPLFGIMIADYYHIQKGKLNNKDIYSIENNGEYYYSGGWHIKGVCINFRFYFFSINNLERQSNVSSAYSWMIGAFISSITYYLLAKE